MNVGECDNTGTTQLYLGARLLSWLQMKCKIEFNYNEISGCSFPLGLYHSQDFPVAQMVKNLPAMQETRVVSLGWEDSLEKGTIIHFSILAWRIPSTEEPGGLPSIGSQRVRQPSPHALVLAGLGGDSTFVAAFSFWASWLCWESLLCLFSHSNVGTRTGPLLLEVVPRD